MPGLPSTTSVIESPTGCTKQLMSVAVSVVPAAELILPAGMKPCSCASRNFASHCARLSSASAIASARATRRRTSSTVRSEPLAYFSRSTSPEISCSGNGVAAGALRSSFLDSTDCIAMLGLQALFRGSCERYAGSPARASFATNRELTSDRGSCREPDQASWDRLLTYSLKLVHARVTAALD